MRIGLIGDPVAHSASPRMQNAAFAHVGLGSWTYELWHTPLAGLADRVDAMRRDSGIGGCNVTVPHKQNVMPLIDAFSDHARALGAVNTIVKQPNGALWGDNTDWRGFMADLAFHGASPGPGSVVLVLGAGGSARGVAYGLVNAGCVVRIVNRNTNRAATLAGDLSAFGDIVATADHVDATTDATLIVNCTSAGMSPHDDTTSWPEDIAFPGGAVLYDLVYKPRVTRLMRTASAAGARVIGGIGMLAEQGAAAFELWTNIAASRVTGVMRAALETPA
jgi:shikimate dehydrogenase